MGCPPGHARVEVAWVDPTTGRITFYEGFPCVSYFEIENDNGTAPPPASAEAPARDAVAEAIPDRVVRVNPHPRGMTGMDTWLWYDDDGDETTAPTTELTVTATVPGISVTSTAAITSYCWDVDGDGSDEVCTDTPGTEEHPAFTHVYESTGTYQVRLTVTWGGSFSVNGAPPVAFDPVQRTYAVDYEVIEVRSVLTG